MTDLSDETFSHITNEIINEEMPFRRVALAQNLQHSLFSLLCVPKPVLEQLISKIEDEMSEHATSPKSELYKLLITSEAEQRVQQRAARCIGSLKSFVAIRDEFVNQIKSNVPEKLWPPYL